MKRADHTRNLAFNIFRFFNFYLLEINLAKRTISVFERNSES